jgi:GAF domain-containing protein
MKITDYLPTKLKWFKLLPQVLLGQSLNFIKGERRWWVLAMIFIATILIVFRKPINHYLNYRIVNIEQSANLSREINEELKHVLEGSAADRAYIFQFHNGVELYTSEHGQRFSCTYEVVSPGTSTEAQNLQELYVSVYAWFISETLKGDMIYKNTEEIPDYTTKAMLRQQGIESILATPLIHKGQVVGILGIDYLGRQNELLDGIALREWIESQAKLISNLIANK